MTRDRLLLIVDYCIFVFFLLLGTCTSDKTSRGEYSHGSIFMTSVEREMRAWFEDAGIDILSYNAINVDYDSSSNMTVLSAYFDIGIIPAGFGVSRKDPALYVNYTSIYSAILEPVIFITDHIQTADKINEIRADLPTQIIIVDKSSLWAFKLRSRVTEALGEYPIPYHFYPNYDFPDYTMVTHAKLELLNLVTKWNPYKTSMISWVDIGLYRQMVTDGDFTPFHIRPPPDMDYTKVAFGRVAEQKPHENDHRFVVLNCRSYFCACFFMAEQSVMQRFAQDYIKHVHILLDEGLTNCEEQILAAMYMKGTQFRPAIKLQVYNKENGYDDWYHFGHVIRERGLIRNRGLFNNSLG